MRFLDSCNELIKTVTQDKENHPLFKELDSAKVFKNLILNKLFLLLE
jgi:hypothetical protein